MKLEHTCTKLEEDVISILYGKLGSFWRPANLDPFKTYAYEHVKQCVSCQVLSKALQTQAYALGHCKTRPGRPIFVKASHLCVRRLAPWAKNLVLKAFR